MDKKKFIAEVAFTFTGTIEINADNEIQALEYLQKHVGMTFGTFQTTLSETEIPNWNFDMCPEKRIGDISKRLLKQISLDF